MNKKTLRKLLALGGAMILDVAVLGTAAYSWFSKVSATSTMSFDILQIDSLVVLYQANDANYNGVYDLLDEEDAGTYYYAKEDSNIKYTNNYYTEKYSFNYVEEKYAQSKDSSVNLFNTLTMDNVAPGKVYGYKFEITNYLGADNTISFGFDEDASVNITNLDTFEVRVGIISSSDDTTSISYSEWTPFVSDGAYSGIDLALKDGTTMILPKQTSGLGVGRTDLWLQIRQKKTATVTVSEFTLPSYRLTLEATISD